MFPISLTDWQAYHKIFVSGSLPTHGLQRPEKVSSLVGGRDQRT